VFSRTTVIEAIGESRRWLAHARGGPAREIRLVEPLRKPQRRLSTTNAPTQSERWLVVVVVDVVVNVVVALAVAE